MLAHQVYEVTLSPLIRGHTVRFELHEVDHFRQSFHAYRIAAESLEVNLLFENKYPHWKHAESGTNQCPAPTNPYSNSGCLPTEQETVVVGCPVRSCCQEPCQLTRLNNVVLCHQFALFSLSPVFPVWKQNDFQYLIMTSIVTIVIKLLYCNLLITLSLVVSYIRVVEHTILLLYDKPQTVLRPKHISHI